MGKETGFLEYEREDRTYIDPEERLKSYKEFVIPHDKGALQKQAARCMNCGIPYCHNGCPVNNIIPDWNHLVYEDDWKNALEVLHSTNNFPEFTGRICPAPCEAACTLNIVDEPVTIKSIECAIIDRGWKEGWVKPQPLEKQTGKSVAVVGSGPAGLACAQQLARAGHAVTVFEKSDRIGGLLRYGIPDFKMEKHFINRRAVQMEAEGVQFRTSAEVGVEVSFQALQDNFDAVVLAGGAEEPRQLDIPGAELPGVRLAMEFLTQQNKRNAGDDEVLALEIDEQCGECVADLKARFFGHTLFEVDRVRADQRSVDLYEVRVDVLLKRGKVDCGGVVDIDLSSELLLQIEQFFWAEVGVVVDELQDDREELLKVGCIECARLASGPSSRERNPELEYRFDLI